MKIKQFAKTKVPKKVPGVPQKTQKSSFVKNQKTVARVPKPVSISSRKVDESRRLAVNSGAVSKTGSKQMKFKTGSLFREPGAQNSIGETIGNVVSTGGQILKNIEGFVENPLVGLAELPKTVMKVIDTGSGILRNIQSKDVKEKVVLENGKDVSSKENDILLEKLSKSMPVISTTSLPSAFSTEVSMPSLKTYESTWNGRKVVRLQGSSILGDVSTSSITTGAWNLQGRETAQSFGSRVTAILSQHQMYRIRQIDYRYIPNRGTDYEGQILLCAMDGVEVSNYYPTSGGSSQAIGASQREHVTIGTLNAPCSLTIQGKGDWLYVFNGGTYAQHFYSSITRGFLVYNYGSVTSQNCGQIIQTFDIECTSASEFGFGFNHEIEKITKNHWIQYGETDYSTFLSSFWWYLGFLLDKYWDDKSNDQDPVCFPYDLPQIQMETTLKLVDKLSTIRFSQSLIESLTAKKQVEEFEETLKELINEKELPSGIFLAFQPKNLVRLFVELKVWMGDYGDQSSDPQENFYNMIKFIRGTVKNRYKAINPVPMKYKDIPDSESEEEEEDPIIEEYITVK